MQTIKVIDHSGSEVPSQIESIKYHEDGSIKDCCLLLSIELPSLGYATFYVIEDQSESREETVLSGSNGTQFENQWFRVRVDETSGYPISLVNKFNGTELLDCRSFFFGEILALENIAHDEDEHLTGKYWRGKQYLCKAYLSENGPLRASWTIEGPFKGGHQHTHFHFYRDLARIDISIESLAWRPLRFLPLGSS